MRTFQTAARFYKGYKLKALSLLIFITLGLGLIMGAVDLLYNSFNAFFDRPASFYMPRYFIAKKKDFDILNSFAIADLALKSEQKKAVSEKLGKDFDLVEAAYAWAMFQSRRDGRRFYALVVGVDFGQLERAFPYFKGRLSEKQIAEYRASPLLMLDRNALKRGGMAGQEYTLFSTDYFKNVNGIRVKAQEIIDTPGDADESLTVAVAYIDIGHLKRLFALPEGREYPIIAAPRRAVPPLSIADSLNLGRIGAVALPRGMAAYSVSTVSVNLHKTYSLYSGIVILLSAILALVMTAAISANLAINFQNRRSDFGLMKAFGCSDRRLLGFVLCENGISLGIPLVLACLANIAVGLAVKPFKTVSHFLVYPRASVPGAMVILASAILIALVSSIQPYRYLKRIESVAIMREE